VRKQLPASGVAQLWTSGYALQKKGGSASRNSKKTVWKRSHDRSFGSWKESREKKHRTQRRGSTLAGLRGNHEGENGMITAIDKMRGTGRVQGGGAVLPRRGGRKKGRQNSVPSIDREEIAWLNRLQRRWSLAIAGKGGGLLSRRVLKKKKAAGEETELTTVTQAWRSHIALEFLGELRKGGL